MGKMQAQVVGEEDENEEEVEEEDLEVQVDQDGFWSLK